MNHGNPVKYLVETDVILAHLMSDKNDTQSHLLGLMKSGICYTTVVNAAELLFIAKSENEKSAITDVLTAFKILGLNSRYSLSVNEFKDKVKSVRDALIAVVAQYNNLPVVTGNSKRYSRTNLNIIHPKEIRG